MALGWLNRSIRPPDDVTPNENDPALVPPSTVGPDQLVTPGDPAGVVLSGEARPRTLVPQVLASPWSGWPSDWWPPNWGGHVSRLTDTAWTCVDLNASVLASMPPYLVNAAPTLDAEWLRNPDPDLYSSWDEFAKGLFWDFQAAGEAFVLATAFYSSGWPARFHCVPPWAVNVEMEGGRRSYRIGDVDVTGDICHLRYQSTVDDAHGHGPLEAGAGRIVAADLLGRYYCGLVESGGIPSSVLIWPHELDPGQADDMKAQWVLARQSSLGEPAVLSGGMTWEATQINPADMALVDLQNFTEARIATMLKVPPFLVGLPSAGGESMTYSNATSLFDFHWRGGLRPIASMVMGGLSGFLLPRQTSVELNRDEYVKPPPLERAQAAQIYAGIMDENGNPAITVDEIRRAERFTVAGPIEGVLR